MAKTLRVALKVNGLDHEREVEPRKLLVDFLREDLELIGTHVGCEQGICGSCTILFNGKAVRSCLLFAAQAQGAEITTVEGLAGDGKLHPIQEAFHEHHGLQCGFCTPGMLITTHDFLSLHPQPSEEEARLAVSGVLCRCTGYKQVVDSVMAAATKMTAK